MGLENILGEALPEVLTTRLDSIINWARKSSLWPATFGLACCAIEMMNATSSRNDLARFGAEVFRASPRQADVMIVSGRVSRKMAPVLRRIYDQMPEPKWVISMGACATSGGVFDNYAIVQGVDKIVPVDVYIPGCPPRPEMLIHAVMMLQDKVMKESVRDRKGRAGRRGPARFCARHAAGDRWLDDRLRSPLSRGPTRSLRGTNVVDLRSSQEKRVCFLNDSRSRKRTSLAGANSHNVSNKPNAVPIGDGVKA